MVQVHIHVGRLREEDDASTDPCGTLEVTGSPLVYGCLERFSPIPASSLAYHNSGVWLPDGGGVLRQMLLRNPAAQRRSSHPR